jgi:hypothetical protein
MWDIIISLLYHRCCKKYLAAVLRQRALIHPWGRVRPPRRSAEREVQLAIGTFCYQFGYSPMTSPINVAIYAFGGFMLLALAVGFFATPV